jgi:hypothetical protein
MIKILLHLLTFVLTIFAFYLISRSSITVSKRSDILKYNLAMHLTLFILIIAWPFILWDICADSSLSELIIGYISGGVVYIVLIYHFIVVFTTKIIVLADGFVYQNIFKRIHVNKSEIRVIRKKTHEYLVILKNNEKIKLAVYLAGIHDYIASLSISLTEPD